MVKKYINRLLNLPKNLVELRVQVERFCRFYTARHLYAFIREIDMEKKTQNGLLIVGGFLLGTLGVKALCPDTAKNGYVQAAAVGMRAKNSYDKIVEQAKAEVDDIVSEVSYLSKDTSTSKAAEY